MKFSKIYIAVSTVFLCLPIYAAYFAITGHLPSFTSGAFPDSAYLISLKTSLLSALLCAVVSTAVGSSLALFFSKLKEKFSVFFTKGSHYEVYIFNVIVFSILWLIIYLNGKTAGFVTLAHCLVCIPLVFCMIYSFSGDMTLTSRCAAEIGSSPVQTFFNITMPIITPSVISGFLASFVISFNDVIIAAFVSRGTAQTFTMKIIEYLRGGADVGSVCAAMLAVTVVMTSVISALCIKVRRA